MHWLKAALPERRGGALSLRQAATAQLFDKSSATAAATWVTS